MTLDEKIEYSINLLRKSEEMALRMDPENGFYLAFSGGKDSQALYHLAVQAGVKFKAHMNLTSVDPPEVIRFVKKELSRCGTDKTTHEHLRNGKEERMSSDPACEMVLRRV